MIKSEFQRASEDWDREVDKVAANLVKNGTPPYEAKKRAQEIVKARRQGGKHIVPMTND